MIDNSLKFIELREKYKEFTFEDYSLSEDNDYIYLEFKFSIPNLKIFTPNIKIKKKDYIKISTKNNLTAKKLAFHIGLIELISYWKCTCSPKVIIKCGNLNEEQIEWFKKLYFYGLGELFYQNNIKTNIEEFMTIETVGEEIVENQNINPNNYNGYIIPIGGGKDSVVTIENIPLKEDDYCLIINPKPVTLNCAKAGGFKEENIIEVERKIDKNLIELNSLGYINGHTPFSSLLAFVSYFIAYLTNKKYIALSNENSANESNVVGEKINHQYSKSYEFENDFYNYTNKYLKVPVKYFSFLRPLNELQIAKLFSRYEKYHTIFKSCNVGSKEKEWHWCCKCPKCLFVYTILSPFLYKDKLLNIFNSDLFEDESLLETFIELAGYGKTKPFECVGTFEEVKFAISTTIKNLENKNEKLPYLLQYYKNNFELSDLSIDITKRYNTTNNLTEELNNILKEAIFSD